MVNKSNLGKTEKYGGIAKSIQKTQQPEEPKITQEEILSTFARFGFPVNQRNHDDILFWSQKPKSDLNKLIDDLHKKREDINKQEDEQKKHETDRQRATQKNEDDKKTAIEAISHKQNLDKISMPRLSDTDISALFDEFGLPPQDPEFVRSHMPNDPKMIRNILSMQRKMSDDMLKKHSKNTVNAIPEIPKNQPMPMQTSAPMMGQGGPTQNSPIGMQGGMVGGDEPMTPFFIGDSAVVKIINPNNPNSHTLWLVNPQKKTLQPFLSEQAFENAFEDPEEAQKAIITLSSKDLGPGGVLNGFTPVKGNQGISNDGTVGNIEFSPAELKSHYNKPEDINGEQKSLSILDGLLGKINTQ